MLVNGAQGKTDGQAQALADDGALQKDTVAVLTHFSGEDLVGQFLDAVIVAAFICHAGHFREDLPADVGDGRIDSSHCVPSSLFLKMTDTDEKSPETGMPLREVRDFFINIIPYENAVCKQMQSVV